MHPLTLIDFAIYSIYTRLKKNCAKQNIYKKTNSTPRNPWWPLYTTKNREKTCNCSVPHNYRSKLCMTRTHFNDTHTTLIAQRNMSCAWKNAHRRIRKTHGRLELPTTECKHENRTMARNNECTTTLPVYPLHAGSPCFTRRTTVVIHTQHTLATHGAMMRAWRLGFLTFVTVTLRARWRFSHGDGNSL
jgi:hypothetical protein